MRPEAMLEERVRVVATEVRSKRITSERESIEKFVAASFTLTADEQRMLVMAALRELTGMAPPKKEAKVKAVDGVLRGKQLIAAAAALFREQPDLSATAVYRELAKLHKIAMSIGSFAAAATEARKLARGDQPIVAPAPTRTPEKVVKVKPRPRTAVARRPATGSPPPVARRRPEPNGNGAFHDGDRVMLELRGEKLDARREDGRWVVAFEGTVADELVGKLLDRMLGAAAA